MKIHTALVTGALALTLVAPAMAREPTPVPTRIAPMDTWQLAHSATPMATPSATPTRQPMEMRKAEPVATPLPSPAVTIPELPPLIVVPAQQVNDLSSALLLTCNVITKKTDLSELLACANNYLHQVQVAHQEKNLNETKPTARK